MNIPVMPFAATELLPPELEQGLRRRLTVLGSTGSIGVSTLSVVEHARRVYGPQAFPIEALTAQSNVEQLAEQARAVRARRAVIGRAELLPRLKSLLEGSGIEAAAGPAAVVEAAQMPAELVMVAIVGAAALPPALAAVSRGATLALANKECVVAAGELFRRTLAASRATVIPVDSEHNAAFQCLEFGQDHAIEKVTLTASGGPFREWTRERMEHVTPEQAVAHPNWSMGAKISVDSATLMNKGLEVIEAHVLFALPPEKLDVIVHPQSAVHCLVSYADGSMLAHLSAPDMRTPIAHALAWPQRMSSPSQRLDLAKLGKLTFEAPDRERFPCLKLAEACLHAGGVSPTILNAANEVAVASFLERRIGFYDIARVVEETLSIDGSNVSHAEDLETVLSVDSRARETARQLCKSVAA